MTSIFENPELAPEEEERSSRKNNVPAVSMGVIAQPGSNQIEIVEASGPRLVGDVVAQHVPGAGEGG